VNENSSGTAWNVPDPVAWYYWNTGKTRFKVQNDLYVRSGLGEGSPPYSDATLWPQPEWTGNFARRVFDFVDSATRPDSTPPVPVSDVKVEPSADRLLVNWTAPEDAAYFLVVWSDRPIVDEHSTDVETQRNWWAANSLAVETNAVELEVVDIDPVYVAVFSFDHSDNMSAISNVARRSITSQR
jgi:hypothetical protein